ncbi:uncharacterized protein LOC132201908 [Neocloeon triangulifer]|uniref:uncharacterized protein LOC132201908 n=1 Tax=Neocloeon triangulifer TaxID=2078957 RepID=UPI00286F0273|nr:uncharacterized protein LOC132201908 [Neocloeon triangulifer]
MQLCCEMGLQLFSIESLDEYNCFTKDVFNLDTNSTIIRTSGTSDGIGCQKTWGWCPSGQIFANGIPWSPGEPGNPGVENCACVQMGGAALGAPVLHDCGCHTNHWFICEGSVPECKPMCPIKTCTKNVKLD